MRKSAIKQQSQVQTMQRTVPSRNATQGNGNINNFWKGSRWFCLQCLRTFCHFLRQNQENGCLEDYIRVRAFKQRPIPIDQVFCTRCMLCLLQSWRVQLTALPGQTIQERKTHSRLSCVLSNTHTFALTQMPRCV